MVFDERPEPVGPGMARKSLEHILKLGETKLVCQPSVADDPPYAPLAQSRAMSGIAALGPVDRQRRRVPDGIDARVDGEEAVVLDDVRARTKREQLLSGDVAALTLRQSGHPPVQAAGFWVVTSGAPLARNQRRR